MLVTLSALAIQQKQPTTAMMTKLNQFLDYATIHSDAVITYRKSVRWLNAHRYVQYQNEGNARSRVKGCHFLSNLGPNPQQWHHSGHCSDNQSCNVDHS